MPEPKNCPECGGTLDAHLEYSGSVDILGELQNWRAVHIDFDQYMNLASGALNVECTECDWEREYSEDMIESA